MLAQKGATQFMQKLGIIAGSILLPIIIVIATTLTALPTNAQTPTNVKVCSAFIRGEFRDSTQVPAGWTSGTCSRWAQNMGAENFQLGCLQSNNYSWGTFNGGIPSPNCGW